MKGGKFQVSNNVNFSKPKDLYAIPTYEDIHFQDYYLVSNPGKSITARYVRYLSPTSVANLPPNGGEGNIAEMTVFEIAPPTINLALNKPALLGSTISSSYPASNGNNGVTSSESNLELAHSDSSSTGNWWRVDLNANYELERIEIYNRTNCCIDRLNNAKVYIANGNLANPNGFDASKMTEIGTLTSQAHQTLNLPATPIARYVYIKAAGNNPLNFLELEAYGKDIPSSNLPF